MTLRHALRMSVLKSWMAALCLALAVFCCGCSNSTVENTTEVEAATEDVVDTHEAPMPTDESEKVDDEGEQESSQASEQAEDVYSGTCMIVNAQQLLEMLELEVDPRTLGCEPEDRFALLVFDSPQVLYSHEPGDPDKMMYKETDMVCLTSGGRKARGDITVWEPYDGMRVSIQMDPYDIWNPSDARLPLGKPHVYNPVLISVG